MPHPRDPAMLLAAARLYYLQGLSQAEVADTLGTSRSNVSRMLTEAQRQGIVEIRINDPEGRVEALEDELRETFGLRDVRVAHAGLVPGLRHEDQVGTQAARLLLDNLKDAMTVALSWGHALQTMVYATTSDREFHRISLVQLVGGVSAVEPQGDVRSTGLLARVRRGAPRQHKSGCCGRCYRDDSSLHVDTPL